jgi:hypothetical protein
MERRLRITIDLVPTQPVGGSISSEGGQPASFDGWLELHAALEALCEAAREGTAPQRRVEPRR